jgi:hypothetical protein
MKRLSCFLLSALAAASAYAAPDRGVWVLDQLVGFRDESMIYRQTVTDNEGSHYSSHIETYLVEKNMRTNEVVSIDRIAYVEYRFNSGLARTEIVGRSEDKLREVIDKRPQLFYELDYAIPLGLPDGPSLKLSFKDDILAISDGKEGTERRFDVRKIIPATTIKEKSNDLLQTYEYRDFLIVLVDFGRPTGDENYYQKLIAVPR